LLKVEPANLEQALLKPRIKAGNELVATHLSPEKASYSRDALCKALYGRMFLWIVQRVNKVLAQDRCSHFIGILDIAGFEIFQVRSICFCFSNQTLTTYQQTNSFEQLCINYTNERLQQFFNHHMFKLEQEEYIKEKIEWTFIDFGLDSQPAIDLIEKKPAGLLVLLDEESVVPKGTDDTYLKKLHEHHERNPLYEKPRFSKDSANFTLTHYAGKVVCIHSIVLEGVCSCCYAIGRIQHHWLARKE